jgi:predicted ATP-dependent endonuclease of OLD family
MKLTRFKIQKYKCVLDSDWVNVSSPTVLVGKNEAGKTSLLKALHKFNPFKPEPYSMLREWPRGFRGGRSDAQVVCTTEFQLTAEELKGLQELAGQPVSLEKIEITKDYAGRFEVLFPAGLFPEKLHPNDIDALCNELPEPASPVSDEFRQNAEECRKEAIRLAHEGRFSELAQLRNEHNNKIPVRSNQNPQHQNEHNFRNSFLPKLDELGRKLKETQTVQQKAHDYVIRRLPTFVYMDEYQSFCGTAKLDVIKRRKDSDDLQPSDETFLTILALADLDFDKEFEKAGNNDVEAREERQYEVSDGEATLNRKIEDHWRQMRYQVQFRVDGYQFMTFVKGIKDTALIRLEDRSKGFQWFFSFDLMLMHETRGKLKDCVILLDEPGLHLHPEGQTNLLERLTEYAKENTLIYTTHLPFMIDLQEPERIRVLSETDGGTVVSEDLTKSQPAAKLVLQAALGISGRTSWLIAEQNLVVEGADDYWILTELSNLFRRSGKEGLPLDVFVTAAGGASEVTYLATFMVGQELDVVALFDNDIAGRAARDKLVKSWLPKYPGQKANALDLAAALGNPTQDFCIEELFPEQFYIERVQKAYEKQIAACSLSLVPLLPGNLLAKRVEGVFASANVPFNKRTVCKRIASDIRQMKNSSELPQHTRLTAEKLFAAITKGFSK